MAIRGNGTRPLGAQQRNWLAFLRANPGPNFVELPQKELEVIRGLQRRGLVCMEEAVITGKRGIPVWEVEALQ
jgi:hypothetical protein